MRGWSHKIMEDIQMKLKPTVTEDFRKEFKDSNPSQPELEGKLSEEHQKTVDERVSKQANAEL